MADDYGYAFQHGDVPECHDGTCACQMPVRCPECAAGKHVNCTGQALNVEIDQMVVCWCVWGGEGHA